MLRREIPNEYKLILLITRLEINNSIDQEIRKLLNNLINWNEIIKVSNHQQILPFLYYNIGKLNLQNFIPQDIFAEMKNCYYANLNRNIILEKEISLILELTNRKGINIIPLKGFDLLQTLYHNPSLRIMADVDILIKQNQFQEIKRILNQLGYHQNPEENIAEEYYHKILHETTFSKTLSPNQFLAIDIHRTIIPPRPYRLDLPASGKEPKKKPFTAKKYSLYRKKIRFYP